MRSLVARIVFRAAVLMAVIAGPHVPLAAAASAAVAPPKSWPVREADYIISQFRFRTGETLDGLRIHYKTLGQAHRDANGQIDNAVMILHGTGGSSNFYIVPQFTDELFGPDQPLDISRYWIIIPDGIGGGKSSKPSDGLRMRFPHYDYDDMVEAQYRLLHDHLGIAKMRLIMGISMGGMQSFVWGETHPEFVRALLPMACEPIEIAGFNRMWRQLLIDGIKADPAWVGGEYTAQPAQGLRTAASLLFVAVSAPVQLQKDFPDGNQAIAYARDKLAALTAVPDANDLIYQVDASRNYNPWPRLEAIKAPITWLNSSEDLINPRNLDVPQRAIAKMRDARFRLIGENADTQGHGSETWAVNWKDDLRELMARTEEPHR